LIRKEKDQEQVRIDTSLFTDDSIKAVDE